MYRTNRYIFLAVLFFILFQNSYALQEEQNFCKMVTESALRAEIALLCNHDKNYPQRTACYTMHGKILSSCTQEKALQCLHASFLKFNPVIAIVYGEQGSVSVTLERMDFDEFIKQHYQAQYNKAETIFDFYQVGN